MSCGCCCLCTGGGRGKSGGGGGIGLLLVLGLFSAPSALPLLGDVTLLDSSDTVENEDVVVALVVTVSSFEQGVFGGPFDKLLADSWRDEVLLLQLPSLLLFFFFFFSGESVLLDFFFEDLFFRLVVTL